MSYPEAIDLVAELRKQYDSHLHADLQGWSFAAGYGEIMSALSAAVVVNIGREKDKLHLPFPWPDEKGATADVTPEERAALTQSLISRSAFAHE